MKVLTRNPQFSIKFVSLEYGEIPPELVRPAVRQISVRRRLGNAAGSFEVVLLPRPVTGLGPNVPTSWRDLLGAMDYVEISLWVPPRPPTVVMRAFVDTVTDSFDIQGGTPRRHVIVTGRDFGKLLLNTKLYYPSEKFQQFEIFKRWKQAYFNLFAWKDGQLPDPEHNPLPRTQQTDLPSWRPLDLLNNAWDAFYVPQQDIVLRQYPSAPRMSFVALEEALQGAGEDQLRVFAPTALPINWPPFFDLWALMKMYQHHPWRELFVDDYAGPVLVYRPTPWLDFNGNFVYDAYNKSDPSGTLRIWDIPEGDIVSYSLSHSDDHMRNFFFTYPDRFAFYPQMAKTFGNLEGLETDGNPYLVGSRPQTDQSGVKRSDFNVFGFQLDERRTPYLDFDHGMSEGQIETRLKQVREQGRKANLELVRAWDHNSVLEAGTIQIPGDERIHIGNFIKLEEGARLKLGNGARYYIEGLSHTLRVGSRNDGFFMTTLGVSGGRGHLIRKGVVKQ